MRSLFIVTILASAYACGGNDTTNFTDPAGSGAPGGGVGNGGTVAGGTAGDTSVGGTSGSASNGGTSGTSGTNGTGGDATAGAGAAANAGAAGDVGSAGAGGAGGAPPTENCPGTDAGCVIDWAGTFGTLSEASVDGVGQAAVFGDADGDPNYGPRGITGDGTYLYVAGSDCIRRIEIATATVQTIAGVCGTPGYVNEIGADARFNFVDGLATDGTTLWVNDSGNNRIREVDLGSFDVNLLTGSGLGPDDGASWQAEFDGLRGMVRLGDYLYVTEEGNHAVRRITLSSGTVATVAGVKGETGDVNGAGTIAEFDGPRKITTDGTDLFVADTNNHLLRRVVLGAGTTSTVSTFAGFDDDDPNLPGHLDGPADDALFNGPRGVAFDGTHLIVADSDNCVIRKLADGVVSTIAGSVAAPCANHAVGVGTAAEFNKPMDVHYDAGTGDLFILENSVIRRMYYK